MHLVNLFALEQHLANLSRSCNRLERLAEAIDFEYFRDCLTKSLGYDNRPQGGRPPFDPVLMLKILFLQTRSNLSDRNTEIMVRDRLTWLQFLGLPIGADTPDECTIRHFRNRLTEVGLLDDLMACFYCKLDELGYDDDEDWMADGSIVSCPKQHNTAAENAAIKAGKSAQEIWPNEPHKAAQKDTDARWTAKKGTGEFVACFFGFTTNALVGRNTKLIRACIVTAGNSHDGHQLGKLFRHAKLLQGNRKRRGAGKKVVRRIYADKAYRSEANEALVAEEGMESHILKKKPKGKPMPEAVARANAKRSSVRARVEHVFARQKSGYGLFVRTISLARAATKIQLANLTYNLERLVLLEEERRRCTA